MTDINILFFLNLELSVTYYYYYFKLNVNLRLQDAALECDVLTTYLQEYVELAQVFCMNVI